MINPAQKLKDYLGYIRGDTSDTPSLKELITFASDEFLSARLLNSHGPEVLENLNDLDSHDQKVLISKLADHATFQQMDYSRLRFEADRVQSALSDFDGKVIVLKGGAYALGRKKAGLGRRVSDLDIMVDASKLVRAERLLIKAGWSFDEATDNPYDQVYYRAYMHELPPMRHKGRNAVLDVHHAILPKTCRVQARSDLMIQDAVPIKGTKLYRFTDIDLFLHASAHHLIDGDLSNAPRAVLELIDLYEDVNPDELVQRARELNLQTALYYALSIIKDYHGNADIAEIDQLLLNADLKGQGSKTVLASMKAVINASVEVDNGSTKLSKLMLYIRSHYMRMPFNLLIPHLWFKAKLGIRRRFWYFVRRFKGPESQ